MTTNQTIDGVPREITEAMSYYFGRDEVANFKLYLRREFKTRESVVTPPKAIVPGVCMEQGKLLQRLVAAEPCLLEKIHYVSDESGDYRNYKVELFIPTSAKRPEPFEVAAAKWAAGEVVIPAALPDRKSAVDTFSTYGLGECAGWNACLDAVSETLRLEQVATESWRDAFFKLHDQMAALKAEQPAPVAHTMKSVMKAICSIDGFPMLTSNQCHALAVSLNKK